MPCSNFEKSCHLCFSSFRGRLFEGKRLGFCKKVGWLTFNLQRAQFSLDCGFLLNNPTLGVQKSISHFLFQIWVCVCDPEQVSVLHLGISTMKISDSYFYHFYFCPDPCSSVKPGVHTVGRSVGRRALLFTVCSLQNAIFTAVAGKKQNCKSCWKKRFSNVSSSLQLHCFSENFDYWLLEMECFESLQSCTLSMKSLHEKM